MAVAPSQTQDDRIADLVVQRGMLTQAQVDECRALQARSPQPTTLAQVIVTRRLATPDDLRALVQQGARSTGAFVAPASASGSAIRPALASSSGVSPAVPARPTGAFDLQKLNQPTEDPEVAFGRFLVAQGTVTTDQAREGYRLLLGYRAQHPQVNLSQVLAKHGFCDKDRLRLAYQQFTTQRAGPTPGGGVPVAAPAPAPPAGPDPRASAGSNPFFPEPSRAAPPAAPAGKRDDRFGYKTVELDPAERPDYDPRGSAALRPAPGAPAFGPPPSAFGPPPSGFGPPPSGFAPAHGAAPASGFAPAFGAPAGTGGFAAVGQAPADPGALDAFLPIDSGPDVGAPGGAGGGWVESETLVDRPRGTSPGVAAARGTSPGFAAPRGPGATHGPGSTHPGPGQTNGPGSTNPGGPGSTDPGPGWGPRGTHAGPRSTHRQGGVGGPIRDDAAALGLDLAPAVQLPGPAVVGAPVEDDEDDEDDEDEAGGAAKGARGDTNVQSSTFGGARPRKRGEPARKAGPPVALLGGVAAVLVLVVCGVAWTVVSSHQRAKAKAEFLTVAQGALEKGKPSLQEAKDHHDALPAALLEDAEVDDAGKKLQKAIERAAARKKSQDLLATLPKARDAEERLSICHQAVEADPSYANALVARARAKYAVARSKALAGPAPTGARVNLAAEALVDVNEAINQEPDQPLAHVVKGQLLLLNRGDPDARLQAESALRNAVAKDDAGALGALAQGLIASTTDQLDPAIEAFTKAIQRDPALLDAYLARAQARLRKREFGKALDDANLAARHDGSSADALTLQAEARYFSTAASDRAGALQTLDKALKLDPSNPHALAVRAFVRLERDRIGDVVSSPEDRAASKRDAERAVAIAPDEPLGALTLAELAADGNPVEAKQWATRSIEFGRHLVQTWLCRGRLRGKEGDEYAIQDFDEVLKIEQSNAQALTNKAAILFATRRDAEQATVLLDQAIQADPEIPWAYYWRGMIALAPPRNSQKYQQAISDFSEAIARQPQFPDAYFRRACAFHDTGRYEDCLKDLEQAEAQRSQSGSSASQGNFQPHDVFLMRGNCHFYRRAYAEAEAAYQKYREKAPPGAKAMPTVMRRLDELPKYISGERTPDAAPTQFEGDDPGSRRR